LIPIGVGEAGRMYYRDIADMPHVLIGGATNQGKSVWMKQALITLMLRNDPSRLKLIMIDLKGGVELSQFKDVPHLLLPLVKEKHGVIPALEHTMKEVKRRLAVFESRNAVNISNYNQRNKKKMDYWIVVVDELANLMLDKELRGDAETLLADIAAQSRAAGIHLMVATQRPDASVVSGLIRANFPVRVAFSCSDYASSKVILDTTDAAGLTPVGRMIYFQGATKTELQGPLITPTMVQDKVEGILVGEAPEVLARSKKHNLTPQDLFRHALTRYDGRFPTARIWEDMKAFGIAKNEVEKIARRFDGKEVEIDGVAYVLVAPTQPDGAIYTPRRLEALKEQDEPEEPIQGANHDASQPQADEPQAVIATTEKATDLAAPGLPDSRDEGGESDTPDADDEHPEPFEQFSERINSVFAVGNE
jgi:DNA segregation ATPase FtsK/SpoIIIE-like protein